jgi:cytochrome c-type biogenesis protein CcmH
MMRILAAALLAAIVCAGALADPAFDSRLRNLEEELRCLVCQNQTLADSNAPLAEDLRREVRELAVAGKSDDEIKQYLVARYGDFVLYRPPVKTTTWLLWFGPFVLLAGGGVIWWLILRRRGRKDDDDGGAPPSGDGGGGFPPSGDDAARAGVEKARELLDRPIE